MRTAREAKMVVLRKLILEKKLSISSTFLKKIRCVLKKFLLASDLISVAVIFFSGN